MTDLEQVTLTYWRTLQRIRRLPVPAADKLIVLADVEAIYLRERELIGGAGRPRRGLGAVTGPLQTV